ncbi:MAG: zinc-dependent alcohol dehydrogenase family protein [Candidatus Caldatribacteriaceae bacterium]
MVKIMLSCVFEERNRWQIREIPEPEVLPDEVLIKVKATGICGTDLHILKGEYFQDFPIVAGHEFSGVVVGVGKNVTSFRPGDRVTADPNIFCDRCYYCKINKNNHCLNLQAVGVTRNGAFAELVAVPEKCVFLLPPHLDFDEGAMAEPLACVVYGVRRSGIKPGEKVLIFGAGPIGILLASLFRVYGASQVVMVDVSEKKLKLAREFGADTVVLADGREKEVLFTIAPHGFEVVVDATGIPQVMEKEWQFVEPDGTFLVFGVAPRGSRMSIDPYEIFQRDLRVVGSFAVKKTMQYSLNLLETRKIQVKRLISARYPLSQFGKALQDVLQNPDHLKVQITWE